MSDQETLLDYTPSQEELLGREESLESVDDDLGDSRSLFGALLLNGEPEFVGNADIAKRSGGHLCSHSFGIGVVNILIGRVMLVGSARVTMPSSFNNLLPDVHALRHLIAKQSHQATPHDQSISVAGQESISSRLVNNFQSRSGSWVLVFQFLSKCNSLFFGQVLHLCGHFLSPLLPRLGAVGTVKHSVGTVSIPVNGSLLGVSG